VSATSAKIALRADAAQRTAAWRALGQKIVFTNGVFDLVHRGHVEQIEAAKAFGDRLVIGVNDDASVRRLKGASRPLAPLEDRQVVLAALQAVDLVTSFDEDTPEALIEAIKPDVLVKGADYAIEQIAGAKFVQSYGGRVETVAMVPGHSTTALLEKIKGAR
jgi:rfaE bifunctional protein nucleotidyltransferase chain/domain